jgi:hypothetical protein
VKPAAVLPMMLENQRQKGRSRMAAVMNQQPNSPAY